MSDAPRIFEHGTTDSTNERAFAALAAGDALHGDVHVADAQTAGRGSRGREWVSDIGDGLYASVLWMPRPESRAARSPAALTMAAGLAIADALGAMQVAGVRLKWPNDVLIRDEKVAGILIESRRLDPSRPAFVCGFGINVRQRAFPEGLRRPATSLAVHGLDVRPRDVLARVLPHLSERFLQAIGDVEGLADAFRVAAGLDGPCRLELGEEALIGEITGFSLDGLELADDSGGTKRIALEHVTGLSPA